VTVDDHVTATTNDDAGGNTGDGESWLAEQARLVLIEDGS
jgi:hypothetical protein